MNVKKNEYNTLESVCNIMFEHRDVLTEEELITLNDAYNVLQEIDMRKKKTNEKTYGYIKEKRKTDKNYGRKKLDNGKYL